MWIEIIGLSLEKEVSRTYSVKLGYNRIFILYEKKKTFNFFFFFLLSVLRSEKVESKRIF